MVTDTGASSGTGDVRPLNRPLPLPVQADDSGQPAVMKLRGRWLPVEEITDRWRIDDEWWRERPISRTYYSCTVDRGLKLTLFQDLLSKEWYLQRG